MILSKPRAQIHMHEHQNDKYAAARAYNGWMTDMCGVHDYHWYGAIDVDMFTAAALFISCPDLTIRL